MSFGTPSIIVSCDVCGGDFDFDYPSDGDNGVNKDLERQGWTVDGNSHTCPGCVEDAKEEK